MTVYAAEVDGTIYYADYGLNSISEMVPAISYLCCRRYGDRMDGKYLRKHFQKGKVPISDCALDQCSYRNLNNPVYKEGTYPSKTFGLRPCPTYTARFRLPFPRL